MKPVSQIISVFVIVILFVPSVYAVSGNNQVQNGIREEKKEMIAEKKQEMNNIREKVQEQVQERMDKLKNMFRIRAFIHKAKVTAKSGNNITLSKDEKSYSVNIDANTKLRRRYFGEASYAEIIVGHEVDVVGKWTDETKTTIQATLIRDLSIQKRFGVFIGTVKLISGNDITLETVNRGSQKATVSGSTKFVNRKEEAIVLTDIQVGHRIRVKGLWDNVNNTITEVSHLKDYNLPPIPTRMPKPTIIVGPTITPTPTSQAI